MNIMPTVNNSYFVSSDTTNQPVEKTSLPTYTPENENHDIHKPIAEYKVEKELSLEEDSSDPESFATLKSGLSVRDYSRDKNFLQHLLSMSKEEANELRQLIIENPDEYPMPCMALTADIIKADLRKTKNECAFTPDEEHSLLNIERELEDLSPQYPYEPSLILSYKYLHYRSLLYFREQLSGTGFNLSKERFPWTYFFYENKFLGFIESIGINRKSLYKDGCTLSDLEQLPWSSLIKNSKRFLYRLDKNYYSTALQPGRRLLDRAIPLIPYAQALGIDDLNKLWTLPFCLAGFSLAEFTLADNFDMSPAFFFEHDIFHTEMKYRFKIKEEEYNMLSCWIKHIYNNRDNIKSVNFRAVELVIFTTFHELSLHFLPTHSGNYDLADIFNKYQKEIMDVLFRDLHDLPPEYKNLTRYEAQQAVRWLALLQLKSFTDDEFVEKVRSVESEFKPEKKDEENAEQNLCLDNTKRVQPCMRKIIKQVLLYREVIEGCGFNHKAIIESIINGSPEPEWAMNFLRHSHLEGAERCRAACISTAK